MYICNYCKEIFEIPREIKEIHFECSELPCEIFYVCPMCESEDIENYKGDIT